MSSRVLIVDDHPMVREALAVRVSMVPSVEICGEASTENEAIARVNELRPDLVLIDITLESGNGIELIKRIRAHDPDIKMLVISAFPESLDAERALRAGASGYLNKQESSDKVVEAIQIVLAGDRFISDAMTQRLLNHALGDSPELSPLEKLSDRELEVFQLIGQGLTGAEIAKKLHLSVHTIDSYREKIKPKIGVKNGVELQREAVRWTLMNEQTTLTE